MGSIAVLGGGTHEWLIWLANPLCFTAILCLIFDKKKCNYFAFSIILSLSFLSSNTILVAESGTRGEILTIKSGYMVIKFCDFDNRYIFLLQKSSRNKI
jgi:hypothetical protein